MRIGIASSYTDTENGMTMSDMEACRRAANTLGEIIVFRSTGPWSLRWLEAKPLPYPSKNFHVKGKSSDWGPQAGFVPYDGFLSKVGNDEKAAKKGTAYNQQGIESGFAGKEMLRLTRAEIKRQLELKCEAPARTALDQIQEMTGTDDLILIATRPADKVKFNFLAHKREADYDIYVVPRGTNAISNSLASIVDRYLGGKLPLSSLTKLEVMVSEELGAKRRPMTGDYDLMAICPPWKDYMERTRTAIVKPAIELNKGIVPKHKIEQAAFGAGSFLDKVLDMRLTTGAPTPHVDFDTHYDEHEDMGNMTPRILRAINMLNAEMGSLGSGTSLRRVHHNAESHRNLKFGALTNADMTGKGDGFPLTAFHSAAAARHPKLSRYTDVVTLESMGEFREYAKDVQEAGYYVPKNWTWGMSIRDSAKEHALAALQRFPRGR